MTDAMTSLSPIWERILKQGDCTNLLRELGPFDYVRKDVISKCARRDLVQFDATTYATINSWAEFETAVHEKIAEFFWAPSANLLLRTVCGCADIPIEAPAEPPEELLPAPGCNTCGQIRAFAEKKNDHVSEHWVRSTIPTVQYYTGMMSSFERFIYYFNCAPEESVEIKDWDKEPVMVIGYRAELPRVLHGTTLNPRDQLPSACLIDDLINWAKQREDVVALAIVGSHARETARPDSDIDVMVLCDSPQALLQDQEWRARFGTVARTETETWGVLKTLRTFYEDSAEVEFNLAPPSWAAIPLDLGTREVISGGIEILHDPRGILAKALAVVAG